MLYHSHKIAAGDSSIHGRGVFALEKIDAGEILEECHFFLLDERRFDLIDPVLKEMVFAWPAHQPDHRFAVVLGGGTIYNHSYENNATWETDEIACCFRFRAIRDIEKGEEIFTNYNRSNGNSFDK